MLIDQDLADIMQMVSDRANFEARVLEAYEILRANNMISS